MLVFLKRHFFFALAGISLLAMVFFVILKETGIVGAKGASDKGQTASSPKTGKDKKDGKDSFEFEPRPARLGAKTAGAVAAKAPAAKKATTRKAA